MHPVLFQFGPLTLYSYGLMVALGFLAALGVASRRAREAGVAPARLQNLLLVSLLAGLIGGRAGYVLLHWSFYAVRPGEILRLDHGGLVFYGGLALGLAGAFLYMRRHRMPLWATADLLVPPLVLAHAIGRIGCFLNGCCYGVPTGVPWGVVFPHDTLHRHPTQIYEAAFLAVLFVGLSRVRGAKPGTVLLSYGLLYGLWRFSVEFLRGDNPAVACGFSVFQWASLPLAALCAALLWLRRKT